MSTKKPTILLADDYPAMLELLSQVLENEGYRVVTARDGAAVLELVAMRKSLQLIILEIDETKQQSIEICRRLREFSDVPVVILAGKYEEYDIVRSLEVGADEFITKPFGIVEFMARVKAVLRCSGFPSS